MLFLQENNLDGILFAFFVGVVGFLLYFCSLGPTYLLRIFKKRCQGLQIFFRISGEIVLLVSFIWIIILDHRFIINEISVLGAMILLFSTALLLIGVYYLKTTSVYMTFDDKLIARGIYKKIRHPQALARILMSFGLAMFLNSLLLIVFSVFVVLPGFIIDTYIEDKELKIRLGQSCNEYIKNVSRFLPNIW